MENTDDKESFLAEPDFGEDAADVLERRLAELDLASTPAVATTSSSTAYGTFENRVGIGSALARLPELEPIYGTLPSQTTEPKALKKHTQSAMSSYQSSLSPKIQAAVKAQVEREAKRASPPVEREAGHYGAISDDAIDRIVELEKRVAKKRLQGTTSPSEAAPPYDAWYDVFTKKGRKKMKEKKTRVNAAVHEEKARINRENLEKGKEKEKKATMEAVMTPSERLARADLPSMHAPSDVYAGVKGERRPALRMKAIEEQARNTDRERARKQERLMLSLAPSERALYGHIAEVVRHGPGVALDAMERDYKKLASSRASELNYYGALAMGAIVGKLRASFEDKAQFSLKRATDTFHEQSTTPMDAAKAITFANALDEYSSHVRRAATSTSHDYKAQAQAAISLGENLANALLQQRDDAVALTAVTNRLFESMLHSTVPDKTFLAEKMQSFWASNLTEATWKDATQRHFE